ncbi:hypothetical protein [Pseudonocardia sp. ICBG601]|uniref:hypothetical protein n=1 Tax=Pseudonocardia sp. ICBG601 TaxID=2846759 RepID=UPI001CF68A19|nr:hypothetical protein [Pseudonocardia sp. ICBG601]
MLIDGTDAGVADQVRALRALVGRLDDAAGLLAGIRDAVADAWDDPVGHAVTARLDLVGREMHRLADEAARDAARAEDTAPADPARHGPPAHHDTATPGRSGATESDGAGRVPADVPGMRLPGLTGTRVTDRRGPVAPSLADPSER